MVKWPRKRKNRGGSITRISKSEEQKPGRERREKEREDDREAELALPRRRKANASQRVIALDRTLSWGGRGKKRESLHHPLGEGGGGNTSSQGVPGTEMNKAHVE